MGEVFAGRYELLDPIAAGGMGTVWRVHDHTAGDIKAAKMLRQADAAMLLRFVREQSVRIDHTHVVTPQSWAGVDDRVLFTMPLVRGGSVSGLVKRAGGTLPPRWIAALTDQTLQALEAVHAAGIVHRDIKPGNLLLEPTGTGRPHLRLTDFGIAVPSDEPRLTHVAMIIGTPGYMAPEQYHGADPAPAADIYALGVVILEMLTGQRPPGDGPPPPVDIAGLRSGRPEHDAILDLVAATTAPDPAQRPTAAALLAHPALRSLVARWDDPALADDLTVPEEYADTPEPSPSHLPTAAHPPPPPRAPAPTLRPATAVLPPPPGAVSPYSPTRPDIPAPQGARTSAPLDAWLLLGAGVVGLLVALFLLLG
ncbi:serine/threonine-protein kinase [Nocardioides caeni]|uniref:non-specific serine/threonine protein kinase n=1 Tax=Nocardioides caeni TaxID=574700 RepID=A0A4S8MZV0_9ACTN|nr:serine/threonine-protein kinase [Nocardioides caeni]THV08983.1 serine/threonine protein kinase [Nocardioides caeni]